MRKFTLVFVILGIFVLCSGQAPQKNKLADNKSSEQYHKLKGDGQVFWSEDFDWENPEDIKGWTLPEGWLIEENDSLDLGYTWVWTKDSCPGYYANRDGGYILNSTTGDNGYLIFDLDAYNIFYTPDNWAEMPSGSSSVSLPLIDCSQHSSVIIRFEQMLRHFGYEQMSLEVTNDNGVHWAEFDCTMGTGSTYNVLNIQNDEVANFAANISEVAAGQSEVLIRITWSGSTLYFWMIDDMTLSEGWDNDLKMNHWELGLDNGNEDYDEGFYYMLPKTQIAYPLGFFEASVENFGDTDQTGVHLNVNITKNGVSQFEANSIQLTKETFSDPDTLYIDETYLPVEFGHYQLTFSMTGNQVEQSSENNEKSYQFHITDSVFSRSTDLNESNYSGWRQGYESTHEGDFLGTEFKPVADCEASSISVFIPRANVGTEFRYVLMEVLEEDDLTVVEELITSDFAMVDSAILKQGWVTMALEPDGEGEFMLAGHTYIAAIQYWSYIDAENLNNRNNSFWIGSNRNYPAANGRQWYFWESSEDWSSGNSFNYMIRLNINNHENIIDGVDNINNAASLGQNYPNPFNRNTEIAYRISSDSDVRIEIHDISGKLVRQIDEGYKNAGLHKSRLSLTDLIAGIYYYTLFSENFTATKKMIISK